MTIVHGALYQRRNANYRCLGTATDPRTGQKKVVYADGEGAWFLSTWSDWLRDFTPLDLEDDSMITEETHVRIWSEDDCTRGTEGHEYVEDALAELLGIVVDANWADSWERTDCGDVVEYRLGDHVVKNIHGAYYEIWELKS